jgi:hypothetical protein
MRNAPLTSQPVQTQCRAPGTGKIRRAEAPFCGVEPGSGSGPTEEGPLFALWAASFQNPLNLKHRTALIARGLETRRDAIPIMTASKAAALAVQLSEPVVVKLALPPKKNRPRQCVDHPTRQENPQPLTGIHGERIRMRRVL